MKWLIVHTKVQYILSGRLMFVVKTEPMHEILVVTCALPQVFTTQIIMCTFIQAFMKYVRTLSNLKSTIKFILPSHASLLPSMW